MGKKINLTLIGLCILAGSAIAQNLTDLENETVRDNQTGLVWQQCVAELSGTNCGVTGSATLKNWTDALDYCESLTLGGNSDWRLPTIKELFTILSDSVTTDPLLDSVFPDDSGRRFSSSTTTRSNRDRFWSFSTENTAGDSVITNTDKGDPYYVRCVRSLQ